MHLRAESESMVHFPPLQSKVQCGLQKMCVSWSLYLLVSEKYIYKLNSEKFVTHVGIRRRPLKRGFSQRPHTFGSPFPQE